jgi:hypothetical protein
MIRISSTYNTLSKDNNLADNIQNMLQIILQQHYFHFNNQYYKQNIGLTMAAPTSAILAETYLQYLEHNHIYTIVIKKVKVSATGHDGAWGEGRYSSYSFSSSALDGGEWSASRPGCALPPRNKPPVPIVQEVGWP